MIRRRPYYLHRRRSDVEDFHTEDVFHTDTTDVFHTELQLPFWGQGPRKNSQALLRLPTVHGGRESALRAHAPTRGDAQGGGACVDA